MIACDRLALAREVELRLVALDEGLEDRELGGEHGGQLRDASLVGCARRRQRQRDSCDREARAADRIECDDDAVAEGRAPANAHAAVVLHARADRHPCQRAARADRAQLRPRATRPTDRSVRRPLLHVGDVRQECAHPLGRGHHIDGERIDGMLLVRSALGVEFAASNVHGERRRTRRLERRAADHAAVAAGSARAEKQHAVGGQRLAFEAHRALPCAELAQRARGLRSRGGGGGGGQVWCERTNRAQPQPVRLLALPERDRVRRLCRQREHQPGARAVVLEEAQEAEAERLLQELGLLRRVVTDRVQRTDLAEPEGAARRSLALGRRRGGFSPVH